MMRQNRFLLAGAVVLALAFLVVPVAAAPVFSSISPATGPIAGGTSVTITGTGFIDVTSVTFGGTAATTFTNSSTTTTITATTPAHAAGAVSVIITTADGSTATGSFTYTSAPTITSLSPSSATNGGWQTIQITGTGFGTSGTAVTLTKSGESTITGTLTGTDAATSISRNFNLIGVTTGTWTLVVLNSDGGTVSYSFTVSSATAATVTSISPTSGITNDTVSVTIAGTGFTPASAKIRLYRSGNYLIGTVNSGGSATSLTGSFDLDYATPATYDVCVLSDGSEASKVCGPTFIVKPENAVNGSLYFSSTPSGASIYVDSTYKGKTPMTLDNVVPGTHTIKIEKAQYDDYTKSVTVVAGEEVTVSASLTYKTSATTATPTTVMITTATLPPTTVKSTAVVPTAWPSDTPVPESPVSFVVIAGALAAVVILVRKQQ